MGLRDLHHGTEASRPGSRGSSRQFPTRLYLYLLVAAVAVPLLAFAAFLLNRYVATERARYERDAMQIARQVALVVDAELLRLAALLKGLSSSTALANGDYARFHEEARRLVASQHEIVVLRGLDTRQLVNTQVPFGVALSPAPPLSAAERTAFLNGRTVVSDVYASPISGEFRIAVAIPLIKAGAASYVLAVTVPTSRLHDALAPAVPAGWIVGIGDSQGTYVTRSVRHDAYSGKPGLPEYLALAIGRSGTFTSSNFDGIDLLAGYYRSELSDWLIGANVPQAAVEAPLWRAVAGFTVMGLAALALSALLAYWFSTRFSAASTRLAARAAALGQGRPVPPTATRLAEFAVVGEALTQAAAAVEERARERERAIQHEALLASIFETAGLHIGIIELLEDDYRYVVTNRKAGALLGHEEGGIDGRRASEVGFSTEEIRSTLEILRRCLAGGSAISVERPFPRGGVILAWLLTTFTPLPGNGNPPRVAFTAIDISERKRSEEQRRLLIHELNHRVKNTLATVQSIAFQTLSGAKSMNEASEALTDRLVALARAHDLLTKESWEGANLKDLVANITQPHGAQRFVVHGPSVWLDPNLSVSITIVLHELATNAVKYGALSAASGSVMISWQVEKTPEKSLLRFSWVERGGPPVVAPTRRGFGSRLIGRILSDQPDGKTTINYAPEGVTCTMQVVISESSALPAANMSSFSS
jgi:PAS domain S-box-containing protein